MALIKKHHDRIIRLSKTHTMTEAAREVGIKPDSMFCYARRHAIKFKEHIWIPPTPKKKNKIDGFKITEHHESILMRVRRVRIFDNVYPESVDLENTIKFTGRFIIGDRSKPDGKRIFPSWNDFMQFVTPYI